MNIAQKLAAFLFLAFLSQTVSAQKLFTRDAKVQFDATAKSSPENIKASNNSGTIVLDQATGRLEAAVLIKSFQFEKTVMQEHFNENYMESSKFPKATFKGKIVDLTKVSFGKDGSYTVNISGDMTMHGVTKPVNSTATFVVKNGKTTASSTFNTLLADYNIAIPGLVADKVGKEAKISISGTLEKMK